MAIGGYKIGQIDLLLQHAENQKNNRCWTLVYVRGGVGMCIISDDLICLNEGDMFLFPPRTSYSFASADLGDEYNESIDAVVIRLDDAWLDTLLKVFHTLGRTIMSLRELDRPVSIVGPKWLRLTGLISSLHGAVPHDEAVFMLDVLRLLSDPADLRPMSASAAVVLDVDAKKERIDRYISCNLFRKILLEDIASYSGMNRTYFCLFFKRHYGMPLMDYVNGKRVDAAASRLRDMSLPVGVIALECGFPTVTYFNRIFKKFKGVSPREYRIRFLQQAQES